MRVVFFGSPQSAIPTLQALIQSGVDIALVVTQPERGRRRGKTAGPGPVATYSRQHGIEVAAPTRVGELEDRFTALRCEAGVVVAYGQLIPKSVIECFPLGILNLHFSLLPKWRGAAPVQRAILAGDSITGVSVMRIEEGLDSGAVYASREMEIADSDDAATLTDRLAGLGAPLVVDVLDRVKDSCVVPVEQNHDAATVAKKLTVSECCIDWSAPAESIHRLVRAASPSPGAWTSFRGRRLKILQLKMRAAGENFADVEGKDDFPPGRLFRSSGGLWVVSSTGPLELVEVQPAGRKAMSARAFEAGAHLGDEEMLGSGLPT